MIDLSEKVALELVDDPRDKVGEADQGVADEGLSPPRWPSLTEEYVEGWMEIHVHIFTREASDYCAVFHRAEVDEEAGLAGGERGIEEAAGCTRKDEVEMAVLVDVVECFEPTEHPVSVAVASLVGLQRLDACGGVGMLSAPVRESPKPPK
jgi:hypothetical protein